MKRRAFLRDTAGLLGASLAPSLPGVAPQQPGSPPGRKPNIVLIVADDLGYANMGSQGLKDIPTPHIDSLAKNGVRFTNAYVSCPVCSPTRAGLMTGRYQQRFGHEFNPGPAEQADGNFGLPLSEVTLADRLKTLGYSTGAVGKWHLGYRPEFHPQKRGFDEFFGFLGGAHPYFTAGSGNPILRGVEPVEEKEYLTEAFAREAGSFLDRRKNSPFFLYLAFNAVHAPMQAPERQLARFATLADPQRRTYAGMLGALDDAVGLVLAKLRQAGLEQNTLILFVSDNGGPTRVTTSRNDPLDGYKGQVLEGGIRVPFLMQWRGRLPAGRVYDRPVIALDIHPTVVAAAGGTLPANLDGVNLLPHVTGDQQDEPHQALYWRFGAQYAIRQGDWKLAKIAEEPPRLYNLARDIGESKDLAAVHPDKLRELEAAYSTWNRQLAAPRWGRPDRRGQPRLQQGVQKRARELE